LFSSSSELYYFRFSHRSLSTFNSNFLSVFQTWFLVFCNHLNVIEKQASEKFAVAIVIAATMMALVPWNNLILVVFLELFTRYSPPRRASTERLMRRLKEWWFSIPAAPVLLEQSKDDNKKTK
jgi:hypothetical protein